MASDLLLVSADRDWHLGMVLIDDGASPDVPESWNDVDRPTGSETVVLVPLMHAVDGPARAELWSGTIEVDENWSCIWDAPMTLPSGVVRLSDAEWSLTSTVTLEPGQWRLRVFVDREQHTEHLLGVFSKPE
jgi:hypothetical protein